VSGLYAQRPDADLYPRRSTRAQAPTSISPNSEQSTIRFGHKGARVRQLQAALRAAGDSKLACDGHFGLDTENALRSFQRVHEMRDDGVAGVATLNLLDLDDSAG
jgi:peptidoglycan hydrolase-like protein with peptidoglycan-binding domain